MRALEVEILVMHSRMGAARNPLLHPDSFRQCNPWGNLLGRNSCTSLSDDHTSVKQDEALVQTLANELII